MNVDSRIDSVTQRLAELAIDHVTLTRDLHDVTQEKASLEYLLKDRLEKLVQQEIEDRINSYKRNTSLFYMFLLFYFILFYLF